ncbi:MAG: DUF3048 C-terminal domain-containing protein, partial [Oscillospiraceae bacterium]|nr:DUF3048 C-terminal domain-containing protein [Oscillospiraceae bacterium]
GLWEKYDIDWEPHVDGNDEAEDPMEAILDFTNVLVLYCSAGVKDDGYTRDYDLTEGTGLYLNGPTCRLIRWQKADVTQGFTIYDVGGNELPIQVGKSYVAVYGGFDGQEIKVEAPNGDDLTLWDDPEPMPTPEPTPEPEPEEEPEPAPEEEGGAEGEPEEEKTDGESN